MTRQHYTPTNDKYAEIKIFVIAVIFLVGLPLVSWLA
jgi:hypothetical protein